MNSWGERERERERENSAILNTREKKMRTAAAAAATTTATTDSTCPSEKDFCTVGQKESMSDAADEDKERENGAAQDCSDAFGCVGHGCRKSADVEKNLFCVQK